MTTRMRPFPQERTRQPPLGFSKVHPVWRSRGLVALFDARSARELISGDLATNRSSLLEAGGQSIAADFSSSANQQYAHRPAFAQTGAFSLVVTLDIDALSNYGAIIAKEASTGTNVAYELRLGSGSGGGDIDVTRANSLGSVSDSHLAADAVAAGFSGTLVVTADTAGNTYVYVAGQKLAHTSLGRTDASDDGASAVWIGRRYDGATQLDGRIYHIGLFDRALPEAWALQLAARSAQLFAPQLVWMRPGAAPSGIPVLSAATVASITSTGATPRVTVTF